MVLALRRWAVLPGPAAQLPTDPRAAFSFQSPLPSAAASAICGQLQSYSDACEALSVIEVTLGFLSTAGEDPNMDVNTYIQDKLRMGHQTEQVFKVGLGGQHPAAGWSRQPGNRTDPGGKVTGALGREDPSHRCDRGCQPPAC